MTGSDLPASAVTRPIPRRFRRVSLFRKDDLPALHRCGDSRPMDSGGFAVQTLGSSRWQHRPRNVPQRCCSAQEAWTSRPAQAQKAHAFEGPPGARIPGQLWDPGTGLMPSPLWPKPRNLSAPAPARHIHTKCAAGHGEDVHNLHPAEPGELGFPRHLPPGKTATPAAPRPRKRPIPAAGGG